MKNKNSVKSLKTNPLTARHISPRKHDNNNNIICIQCFSRLCRQETVIILLLFRRIHSPPYHLFLRRRVCFFSPIAKGLYRHAREKQRRIEEKTTRRQHNNTILRVGIIWRNCITRAVPISCGRRTCFYGRPEAFFQRRKKKPT